MRGDPRDLVIERRFRALLPSPLPVHCCKGDLGSESETTAVPVQQLDLFSWNMQRGSSSYGITGANYFTAAATYGRAELLTRMSARAVGFVQESGADLYSWSHGGGSPNWSTYDWKHDNQLSDNSACRPVLYDRDNVGEPVTLMDCWSGVRTATRAGSATS